MTFSYWTRRLTVVACCFIAVSLAGCAESTELDAGGGDSGSGAVDSGGTDAGGTDAGRSDSGSRDASVDGGPPEPCDGLEDCVVTTANVQSIWWSDGTLFWIAAPRTDDLGNPRSGPTLFQQSIPGGAPEEVVELAMPSGGITQIVGAAGDFVVTMASVVGGVRISRTNTETAAVESIVPDFDLEDVASAGDDLFLTGTQDAIAGIWATSISTAGTPTLLAAADGRSFDEVVASETRVAVSGSGPAPDFGDNRVWVVSREDGTFVGSPRTIGGAGGWVVGVDEEVMLALHEGGQIHSHFEDRSIVISEGDELGDRIPQELLHRGWVYRIDTERGLIRAPTRIGRELDVVLPLSDGIEAGVPFALGGGFVFWASATEIRRAVLSAPPCAEDIDCGGTGALCVDGACG
ncbi:MAG: hypothetical protein AB8I08_36695 [Sandaracinaceae bacterium]